MYQGGGYDGCFWEWNFFAFDRDGKFFNIFTSGRDGVKTEDEAREVLGSPKLGQSVFTYDLNDEDALKEFSRESNPHLVLGMLRWFSRSTDFELDGDFVIYCRECGTTLEDPDDADVQENMVLCPDCLSSGTCDACNEYAGEENIIRVGEETESEDPDKIEAARRLHKDGECYQVCSYCFDSTMRDVEKERKEDTLWQALTTGTPDLFSEEMRDYWTD
jgi:hypothetical protein